ncbi:hypothetical protein D3C86_1408020 [compost metagenome]
MGPVQEKETSASEAAMKKIPARPLLLSALLSILLTNELGRVISKAPKKEIANTTSKMKNKKLNRPLALNAFKPADPKITVISRPKAT